MRAPIASICLLALSLTACSGTPTSVSEPRATSDGKASLQRADAVRPLTGSCTTTFEPVPFPPPPIHHQVDSGSCP